MTSLQSPSPSYFLSVGILQAIAGGTILYVVVFEVLQRERSKQHVPGLLQLVFVSMGFTAMTLVEAFGKNKMLICIYELTGVIQLNFRSLITMTQLDGPYENSPTVIKYLTTRRHVKYFSITANTRCTLHSHTHS